MGVILYLSVNQLTCKAPFEFSYHTGEGEQSLHRTSTEQYAIVDNEPADPSVGSNADSAEHIGRRYLSSLSTAVSREHESLTNELAPAFASAEAFSTLPGRWYGTIGGGSPVYLTDSFYAELDGECGLQHRGVSNPCVDIDEAAILASGAPYGTQDQLSFEDVDGIVTQVGEGAFAETRSPGFDSANGDVVTLGDRSTPDSATKASTLTLNSDILPSIDNGRIEPFVATREEVAADFADLIAGRVQSNYPSDDILLAAGDIDISADLAGLMAQPMSTTATQASSDAENLSEVMSPTSVRHTIRAMSVDSAEDISDTFSDLSGDDYDEVMSEAHSGPAFHQLDDKGKGKAVETGEDGDNEKGKGVLTPNFLDIC